jgi:hypothetical protein
MEFGILKGNIKNISLVPATTGQVVEYAAAVTLPKKLREKIKIFARNDSNGRNYYR